MRPTRYTVNGTAIGRTVDPSRPMRRERFTTQASDATRVRQLENQIAALQQATDAARAATQPRTVTIAVTSTSTTPVLRHRLNRRANWRVVDWKPVVPGTPWSLERVEHGDEANTLILRSYTAGTATIEVT